jgi:hypothetical protein
VPIGAATKNLLLVATTANVVAAFDIDTLGSVPVWTVGDDTLGTPGPVVRNVRGPLGILSTPVIDRDAGRVFVVARSCPTASALVGCRHQLFSLALDDGRVLDSVNIEAGFVGSNGQREAFQPDWQWNRPGLLLQDHRLYVGWASGQSGQQHEEDFVFHGFVMMFDADDIHAAPLLNVTTPAGRGGGIWQGGAGLAGNGDAVFATTGNGILDFLPTSPLNFPAVPKGEENSVVRARFSSTGVEASSFFDDRPYDSNGTVFQYMERWDIDFSSAGPALIPGSSDLVVGGKAGILFLLDQATMTALQPPLSPFHEAPLPPGETLYITSYEDGPQILGAPVVWPSDDGSGDANIYVWPRFDRLTSLVYRHGTRTMAVAASGDVAPGSGAMLSLSANASARGLLWATLAKSGSAGGMPAELRAYDARSLQMRFRADIPGYAQWVCPTVSGGRVYVASWSPTGGSDVIVFGSDACR